MIRCFTSLSTISRPQLPVFRSFPVANKWKFRHAQIPIHSLKLVDLQQCKLPNLGCRYGSSSTGSVHTQDSSEFRSRLDLENVKIILGSSSMARRRILTEMGYEFSIVTADIDEKSIRKDTPEELVMALAHAKADAIISKLQTTGQLEEDAHVTLLITADTVVVYKGTVREKPTSKEEARHFIEGYSGDHGGVVGSVLVTNLTTGKRKGAWESAEVYFHEIPDEIIHKLIEEGVTFNVAGGLMLEHPLIAPFIASVEGRTDTVMGLSKDLTEELIAEVL